jgi:hypothetical protein
MRSSYALLPNILLLLRNQKSHASYRNLILPLRHSLIIVPIQRPRGWPPHETVTSLAQLPVYSINGPKPESLLVLISYASAFDTSNYFF